MSITLTTRERETLGGAFAEQLLHSQDADPTKLPGLVNSRDWEIAEPHERRQMLADIAHAAAAKLLQCGYPPDIIRQKTARWLT